MLITALVARIEHQSYISKKDGAERQSIVVSLVDLDTVSPLNHMMDLQLPTEAGNALIKSGALAQGTKISVHVAEITAFGSRIRLRGTVAEPAKAAK